MQNKEETYKKTGTAGAEGVDYQLNLILHVLLQVKTLELDNFKLYTELKTAGKFDDVVLIYEDENKKERCCLLQAKHVIDESKKISINDLISGDKYNLTKYFDSFKKIIKEKQFKDSLEHLILFTNLNLGQSLLSYVEEVQPQLPIWNCQMVEGNEKKPQLYKLKSTFVDEYQYFQLRALSNVIIDYCIKEIELKHTNNNFKDCHVLLAKEVFNVDDRCFRKEFIEGEHEQLLPATQIFRHIFEEEIQKRRNDGQSCIDVDSSKWLREVTLVFSTGFGLTSSKSKGSISLPIPFEDDEKKTFRKFCNYLILAANQPNDRELEASLTSECVKYFGQLMANTAKEKTKTNIREWLKTLESPPLTCKLFDDVIKYLTEHEKEFTDPYVRSEIAELFNQTIEFETLSLMDDFKMFMNAKGKKLLQITSLNSDLSSIKTISCLSKLQHEYLFTSKIKIKELSLVFSNSTCYHVFVWPKLANSTIDFENFSNQLKDLTDVIKDKSKKVIVILNHGQSVSGRQLGAPEDWIQRLNDETQYGHLTEDTRNKLLKRKVSFQGCKIEIHKILLNDFPLDQVAHDSWGELLSSGNIPIGQEVNLSKEYNSKYYIQRTIVQYFNKKEFLQHALPANQNYVGCEISILSDPAGMGKTTATSSLAEKTKRCFPHYWVTRLVAMECAVDLYHFDESSTSDAGYDDFFMSKLLKLSSPLERFVLGQYLKKEKSVNKLVIIFDGYDEINGKCQRVIVNLLQYLSRKVNIGFIVITTRPQFQQVLEEHFQRKACILRPFDEKNKIEFLQKYWTSTGIKENNNRLTEYAEQLIKCISGSISEEESQLTGIPLQMKMIAEIYKQEARSFEQNEGKVLELSTMSLGLFELYEKFMQIKEEICLTVKLGDQGSAFLRIFIQTVQQHQSEFAIEIILERSDVSKVKVKDLELTLQLGIIQKNPEGDYYFIHRTFAEFLTAKYLLEEFIENASVPVADKIENGLLIEQIRNSSLHVVRKFINSRLNSAKLADECKRSKDKTVIQKLLGAKCTEILITSAEEEIHEFVKLTIEVNSWLSLDQLHTKLASSLISVAYNLKFSTVIQDCILEKWLSNESIILIKTIDILIRGILVKDNEYMFSINALTSSTIVFQNKLEREGVLTEEKLRKILSIAKEDVVNQGKYWNWSAIEYFQHLHSTNRNLFYDFFNDNRTLLHTIMKKCKRTNLKVFLSLIESDKEIDANWVFNNFIEPKLVEFEGWEEEHFKLYFSILHSFVEEFHSERKENFHNYLEEVIHLLNRQFDLMWKGLFEKFLKRYETIISLEEIISKYEKTKSTEDLEYCALWGKTNRLNAILEVGDIEKTAVERFELLVGAEDLAATRRKILIRTRTRQGEEEFLQWIGQLNWRNRTILQHALWSKDDLLTELILEWITTEEIFEKTMRMDCDTTYYGSEFVSILNFVNERLPQYRMRFLELNKNIFCFIRMAREALFQLIEKDENMSQTEFVPILKLKVDLSGYKGSTILHCILLDDDIGILLKLLHLMKKFQLDAETITQLFCFKNRKKKRPLDFIKYDSNYVQRQKKKQICFDFFDKLNLLDLKKEIEKLEKQADSGSDSRHESDSGDESDSRHESDSGDESDSRHESDSGDESDSRHESDSGDENDSGDSEGDIESNSLLEGISNKSKCNCVIY